MEKGESSQPPVKKQRTGKETVRSIFEPVPLVEVKREIDLQAIAARLDKIEYTQQLLLEQFEEIVNMMRSYIPTWERLARQDLRLNLDPPEVIIHEDVQRNQVGVNEAGPSGVVAATAGTRGNVDLNEEPEEDDDDEEDESNESMCYDWI